MPDDDKDRFGALLKELRGQPAIDPPPILTCAGLYGPEPLPRKEGLPSPLALEKLRRLQR